MNVDPITFQVVSDALRTVTAEMKLTIMRTAYSPIVASGGDLSVGIANPDGRLAAQGKDIPVQLGALPYSLRLMLEDWRDELGPGDVLIGNDVYLCGANHINDVALIMPAYYDGELIGYAANRVHWTDIGGATPGSFNPRVIDMHGEGLRIPTVRAYRDYRQVPEICALIFANVRGAREREWDLRAGFAGVVAAERGLQRLAKRYGVKTVRAVMDDAIAYTERRLRARIAEVPDGAYHAVDWMEGDGWQDVAIRMEVTVRVAGSSIEVDWTGTAPQVRGGVNLSLPSTGAVSAYAIAAALDPDIPPNDGLYEPVRVTAPEGTLVNPRPPAPTQTGPAETVQRAADLLMMALARAVPERVIAGTYASASQAIIEGVDPLAWRRRALHRERTMVMDHAPGGMGARATKDGVSGIKVHTGNAMVQAVEVVEFSVPVRIKRWGRVIDTGGPGRQRGGCSVAKEWEALDDVYVSTVGERSQVPPFGLCGGRPGATGRAVIDPDGAEPQRLSSKQPPTPLPAGSVLLVQPAGAGGYGPPWERAVGKVVADVLDGYVSQEAAAAQYGVVLNAAGIVDEAATRGRREALAAAPRPASSDGTVDRGVWSYGGVSVP